MSIQLFETIALEFTKDITEIQKLKSTELRQLLIMKLAKYRKDLLNISTPQCPFRQYFEYANKLDPDNIFIAMETYFNCHCNREHTYCVSYINNANIDNIALLELTAKNLNEHQASLIFRYADEVLRQPIIFNKCAENIVSIAICSFINNPIYIHQSPIPPIINLFIKHFDCETLQTHSYFSKIMKLCKVFKRSSAHLQKNN